jgi:phosphinothricin acetyltransferase
LLTLAAIEVREMRRRDWPAVAAIFAEGIESSDATFETRVPTWNEWDAAHLDDQRLVAYRGNEIVGWAALTPYSGRCAYSGVAEESVYVAARARGRGVGRALLETLIALSEAAGIWTLQAGVFPENKASLKLHFACDFRTVGLRERLGRTSDGVWRDVLLLERRSPAL